MITFKMDRRSIVFLFFNLWDVILAAVGFTLAVATQYDFYDLQVNVSILDTICAVVFLVFWHLLFVSRGLYDSKRLRHRWHEVFEALFAITIGTAVLTSVLLLLDSLYANKQFIILFWLFVVSTTLVSRIIMRMLLKMVRVRHGRNLRHVLIVGAGPRGRKIADEISKLDYLGYRVIGFVDQIEEKNKDIIDGSDLLGSPAELSEIISEFTVDEIFAALPMRSCYELIQQTVVKAEEQGVPVTLLSDLFLLKFAQIEGREIGGLPTIRLFSGPRYGWQLAVKRLMDVVISSVLIIFLSPFLTLVGLLIKLDSPGPAIFRQERVGLNKHNFILYKFRTMRADAEALKKDLESQNEVDGPAFKIRNDPRITRLGHFLRKTSIDEMPQLLNVLKGNLSLVGPRPLPLCDVAGMTEYWQHRRFSMPPGITCIWQVQGRSDVKFDRWMEMDLEYIDNWSLQLDTIILLKTAVVVLSGRGAY